MKSSWRIDEFCIFVVSYTAVSVNCTVLGANQACGWSDAKPEFTVCLFVSLWQHNLLRSTHAGCSISQNTRWVHNKLACTELQAKQKTMTYPLKRLWFSYTLTASGPDSRFSAPKVLSFLLILHLLYLFCSHWNIMFHFSRIKRCLALHLYFVCTYSNF